MKRINLSWNLRSLLTHFGEEKLSTTNLLRRQKFVVGDEVYSIPVYSGNAVRGQCRRLIVKDFLETLGIDKVNLKVYHTLFSGGSLVSGVSLTMDDKKRLCEMFPFVSVLGAAVGDTILQGKVSFSPLYLVCKELNSFNTTQSELSFKDLIDEVFYVRRDDKKSQIFDISNSEDNEKAEPVQMKYDMEAIAAGARMESNITISATEDIELACIAKMLNLLSEANKLGGKSAVGHGAFTLEYESGLDFRAYDEFLASNAEAIKSYITELEGLLK